MSDLDGWSPPYEVPENWREAVRQLSYYDFKRDWPESEKREWHGVVGRIWYNHEEKVLRITFSGEWPDTAMVPGAEDGVMVSYGLVDGRTMQIDIHGVDWND